MYVVTKWGFLHRHDVGNNVALKQSIAEGRVLHLTEEQTRKLLEGAILHPDVIEEILRTCDTPPYHRASLRKYGRSMEVALRRLHHYEWDVLTDEQLENHFKADPVYITTGVLPCKHK